MSQATELESSSASPDVPLRPNEFNLVWVDMETVSYTHLTLPTTPYV